MLRLIRTEFRRFFHRRIFAYGLIGVILIVGIAMFSTYNGSKPPTASELAQAQEQVDQEKAWAEEYLAPGGQCEQEAEEYGEDPAQMCAAWEVPTVNDYLWRMTFDDFGPITQAGLATLLMFFALAVGISFITAEITSGSLSNWLTFAPRRMQVYLSKAVVLTVIAAVVGAIFQAVIFIGLRSIAVTNDALGPDPQKTTEHMLQAGWRITAVIVIAALIGYVVGLVARHAAVGMGAVVLVALVDPIVVALFSSGWRFTVTPRITAWINGEYAVYDESLCTVAWAREEACDPQQVVLTQGQAGWQLLALTAVLLVIGALVMKRRDAA